MEQLDLSILYFFNRTIASDTLDLVMRFLTNSRNWIPVYVLAAVYLVWQYKWYGVRIVVAAALLAGMADALTNMYIKGFLERPRPCALDASGMPIINWLRLPDGGRGGFSLPSSHAVNNFAATAFFVILFPSRRTSAILFSLAFLIAITRPYLGLHYPSDVFAGAVFGLMLGYSFAKAYVWSEMKYFAKPKFAE